MTDYAYDAEGSRTASHLSALYSSNTHNQLLEDDSYTYAYDLKGNRVSRTEKATGDVETYSYDSRNRLVEYAGTTTEITFAYDALGRRIARKEGSNQSSYVYDFSPKNGLSHDDIVLSFVSAALKMRTLHSNNVDDQIAIEEYSSEANGPGAGTTVELFEDHLGSVIASVDPASGINSVASYGSFGDASFSETLDDTPYAFTGREFDGVSGLYYFRARYYDPLAGTFIQSDPILFMDGLNVYGYAKQNPLNLTDPTGLFVNTAEMRTLAQGNRVSSSGATTSTSGGPGLLAQKITQKLTTMTLVGGLITTLVSDTRKDEDPCQKIYRGINVQVAELKRRFWQYVNDPETLPEIGKNSRSGHRQQFREMQDRLRTTLNNADTVGCHAYDPTAWFLANRILP